MLVTATSAPRSGVATPTPPSKPPPRSKPPSTASKVARLAEIARFSAKAFAKTSLLSRGLLTSEEVGAWIVDESTRMGPLFVKISQLVSTRVDALDPALAAALSMVQDEVECAGTTRPDVSGYAVDGGEKPLKAGSIASVWLARRKSDGERVVIKQLHAGIRESFELDLPAIIAILRLATAACIPGAENFYEIMCESESMLYSETDMRKEAVFMKDFGDDVPRGVVVPKMLGCGDDFIVQEYVPSRKISTVKGPNPRLARKLMAAFLTMILDTAIVHADPHPGNLGVLADGTIVLYDFGACVTTRGIRGNLAKLLGAAAAQNTDALVDALVAIGAVDARGSDKYRMINVLNKLASTPPSEFHISLAEQPEFADGSGRRLVRFSTDTVYLLRALSLVEGTCRTLDPGFNYETYWKLDLQAIVTDALERRKGDGDDLGRAVFDWARSAASVPDTAKKGLDAVHLMNVEMRDDLRDMKQAITNMGAAGLALLLLSHL